jgi:hypothetical protein
MLYLVLLNKKNIWDYWVLNDIVWSDAFVLCLGQGFIFP